MRGKVLIMMLIVITILVILNIEVSGVGAATYTTPTPKGELVLITKNLQTIAKNPNATLFGTAGRACINEAGEAVVAHVWVSESVSPFPTPEVTNDWKNATQAFWKVMNDCNNAITHVSSTPMKAAAKDAKKALKLVPKLQKEL